MGFQKMFQDEDADFNSASSLKIYTDGSCLGNGKSDAACGWAYAIVDSSGKQLDAKSGRWVGGTNNQAEMAAVYQSLQNVDRSVHITVFSDSRYVVETIKGNYSINKNHKEWAKLKGLIRQFKHIQVKWVKGHADNKWNNLVDQMANKEASKVKS